MNYTRTSIEELDAALPQLETSEPSYKESNPQSNGASADESVVSIALLLQQLPLKLRKKITEPTGDRSRALFYVIKALSERGFNKPLIRRIIESHAIGQKYAGRSDLDKEIDRVLQKLGQSRAERPDWHAKLILGEGAQPRSNLANAITALSLAPEWQGALAFNVFAQRIELHTKAPWMSAAPAKPISWSAVDDIRTADWLHIRAYSFLPPPPARPSMSSRISGNTTPFGITSARSPGTANRGSTCGAAPTSVPKILLTPGPSGPVS
jgi:hypothetical protein